MEVRYSADVNTYKRMTTNELRNSFLVENLFQEDKVQTIYSDVDRAIIGSAVPVKSSLILESSKKEMAAEFFAERREIGIINIGEEGSVIADGKEYSLKIKDGLYIGRGTKEIEYKSKTSSKPAN